MTEQKTSDDAKTDALRSEGALNPHPEKVVAPLFQEGEFFDSRDLVQVKYEMLRRVRVDSAPVSRAAADFGFSRPTAYQVMTAFDEGGLQALLPKKRGPHGSHKLRGEVLDFIQAESQGDEPVSWAELAEKVRVRFEITVHPRTIKRAVSGFKKKRR